MNLVTTRRRVCLPHGSQSARVEQLRQSDQCWPQAAMNVGNLPVDEVTHENVITVTHGSARPEDRLALPVAPPTAADRFAGYRFGQAG